MPRLELVETALRGGQQAILVSRLRRRHLIPVAQLLDRCGLAAVDAFGGATFEACLRFLAEDPFERLRAIKAAVPTTPLMALLTGQALVGHRHVADDVVDAFIAAVVEAGAGVVRVHDPLNDTRNLERCLVAIHAAGARAEAAIVYTESPVHTIEGFVEVGIALAQMGYDTLCLDDPIGLLGAGTATALVRGLITETDLAVGISSAALTGQSGLAYHAAIEAGAQRVDTALTPLAGGASTPATEALMHALAGTDSDPRLDTDAVTAASMRLDEELVLYRDILDAWAGRLDAMVLRTQLHPQTVAHLIAELNQRGQLERLADTEAEVLRVRAELGHPPLVTPIAEIIATQAVYNVCDGDRYATISQEVKDYCLGLYGRSPGPLDPEVRRAVNGREEPITCRPADLLDSQLPMARREMEREGLDSNDRAALVTYALFPTEAAALARGEAEAELLGDEPVPRADPVIVYSDNNQAVPEGTIAVEPEASPDDVRELTVEVDGEPYRVRVIAPLGMLTNGGGTATATMAGSPAATTPVVREGTVVAPMQGMLLKVSVVPGQTVQLGDVVAVLEAMKMQNDITATRTGTISAVFAEAGIVVPPRHPICQID